MGKIDGVGRWMEDFKSNFGFAEKKKKDNILARLSNIDLQMFNYMLLAMLWFPCTLPLPRARRFPGSQFQWDMYKYLFISGRWYSYQEDFSPCGSSIQVFTVLSIGLIKMFFGNLERTTSPLEGHYITAVAWKVTQPSAWSTALGVQ